MSRFNLNKNNNNSNEKNFISNQLTDIYNRKVILLVNIKSRNKMKGQTTTISN